MPAAIDDVFIQQGNNSNEIIGGLDTRYGVIDYTRWQTLRATFVSWVTYPSAGATQLNFFGDVPGVSGATPYTTNMPKSGSLGQQHFIAKSIGTGIRIKSNPLTTFSGTDASTLASDFLLGFVQTGVLEFNIGARPFLQAPKPFMYLPPVGANPFVTPAGLTSLTGAGGPPTALETMVSDTPWVEQTRLKENVFLFDPQLFIAAEQNFTCSINWYSGLVPVIATGFVNDSTNPLQVGVMLDGVLIRPLQ